MKSDAQQRISEIERKQNVAKTTLEDLFVQELARLQPTAGFMRLVKDRVLTAEGGSREAEPFG